MNDRWSTVRTGDGATVRLLTHEPAGPALGRLVWAHGGSWQRGSAAQWAGVTRQLSAASGWTVASVEYRLAPEHPFPAGVHDVLAAVDRMAQASPELPLAVGGDSSGGTIAAMAAVARRDRGDRVPVQVLAYPPLDPGCARPSYHRDPGAFPRREDLRRSWDLWLGGTRRPGTARPSPLEVPDLSGLAPVYLAVGDLDPVRDDVVEYAARLHAARVPVGLSVLPGTPHAEVLRSPSGILGELITALHEYGNDERTTP
ncbi:alpha/beta hydrolase [Myceligenerans xiligouense]|uniref:alpha/beta hydrolase n=1 Tax=Myceligenerans xiligouense TaxID=253184 RepID=UPI00147749AD|nr:alpha/beta hydrolase [Myceligenerans xiligouense]